MGRRIHKAMGFGLSGLKSDKYRFVDSRLRPDGYLTSDYEDRAEKFTLAGYVGWLRNKIAADVTGQPSFDLQLEVANLTGANCKLNDIDRCIVEAIEFGLPDTLLIIPPFYEHEWTRYDDTIDYHVECLRPDAGQARVDVFPSGIFPYCDSFWDRRTGLRLPDSACRFRWAKTDQNLDDMAKCLGFKDEVEAREHVRPVVPECVLLLCEYLCLFDNPETARYLEPMVYTYWA